MSFIRIEDLNDPRIEAYSDIKDARRIKEMGLFLAEGTLVLRTLVERSRFKAVSLLISERRIVAVSDLIQQLDTEIPVYVTEQALMDQVVGFPIHRGCLAAVEVPPKLDAKELLASLSGDCTILVLEGVSNHDNIGGLFRTAAAFGVSAVILDHESADPLYRKAIRVSIGASLTVPFARLDLANQGISVVKEAGFKVLALTPSAHGEDLRSLKYCPPRSALLLGREGPGLSRSLVQDADRILRIGMVDGFDSLNVNTAGSIALYELSRHSKALA